MDIVLWLDWVVVGNVFGVMLYLVWIDYCSFGFLSDVDYFVINVCGYFV